MINPDGVIEGNYRTSFTGKDNLNVQFAVGNGNAPANQFLSAGFYNSSGTPFPLQSGADTQNRVTIRDLFYSFPAASVSGRATD